MLCPVCKTVNLVMSERQGIEIDYCSQCRGIWLDRGELDKIIERSSVSAPVQQQAQVERPQAYQNTHQHDRNYSGGYKQKKREGFLSDLFDF